jgi:tRNA(Ile)-lysidine synthetase-like protein
VLLPSSDLDLVPPAVASRVIRSAFRHVGVDPTQDAVDAVRMLASPRFRWPGVDVWRLAEGLAFVRQPHEPPAPVPLPAFAGCVEAKHWGIKIRIGEPGDAPWRWRGSLPAHARSVEIRSRRPGDRVPTGAGTKKVQDVLVDAKVPRPLRPLVPVIDVDGSAIAVVGAHGVGSDLSASGRVVDVEPFAQTWSRERAWISR